MTEETEAQKAERENLHKAFRDMLSQESGKRVLFWLLGQSDIYADPFSPEGNATYYLLGRQSIGRRLLIMLDDIDPRLYPTLLLDMADIKVLDTAAATARAVKQEQDDDE